MTRTSTAGRPRELIGTAVTVGIRLFDTSPMYGDAERLVADCNWRQAEALVAAGAFRTEAAMPAREAHAIAARIGARPLLRELELLAQRARLDLAPRRQHSPNKSTAQRKSSA